MEKASFGHRRHERQQQQQQPQQSVFYAEMTGQQIKSERPRNTWQLKAMAQARKQSGSKL
ncbi:MAG TPA: hypothetical protein VN639_18415 [Azonexus sp.]|nr:hypothetical protein [Azonexus sp.]